MTIQVTDNSELFQYTPHNFSPSDEIQHRDLETLSLPFQPRTAIIYTYIIFQAFGKFKKECHIPKKASVTHTNTGWPKKNVPNFA